MAQLNYLFLFLAIALVYKYGHASPIMAGPPEPLSDSISINKAASNEKKAIGKSEKADESDKLVLVQAVWRHGDRTPTTTFKNDVNQEDSWPQGWGQLTPTGMEQLFRLGEKLRKKYIETDKFLSPSYNSREIYVRSSDSNRTIISAISAFIGIYTNPTPGVDYPQLNEWPVNYVPVPVHANVPASDDHIVNLESICPRREKLMKKVAQTPEYKKLVEDQQEFFNNLTEWSGDKITLENIWTLRDALMIEQIHKKKLPDWATKEVIDRIHLVNQKENELMFGEGITSKSDIDFKDVKVIRGGPLLQVLLNNMKQKINCRKENDVDENTTKIKPKPECKWIDRLKFTALSSHDLTLAALSGVLGTEQNSRFGIGTLPTYSTAVTLELWKSGKTNDYYVKFLLWDPAEDSYVDLTNKITECENGCTFEQFEKRSLSFLPPEPIEKYCFNEDLSNIKNSAISAKSSYLLAAIAFIFALTTRRFV